MVAARDHQVSLGRSSVEILCLLLGSHPPQCSHSPHPLFHHLSAPLPQCPIQRDLWTLVLQSPGDNPHLQQPGLQLVVQQDVKTKDLKTGTNASTQMLGEAGSVVVAKDRVGGDDGFDDDVLNAHPYLAVVVAVFLQPGIERRQLPVRPSAQKKTNFSAGGRLPNTHLTPCLGSWVLKGSYHLEEGLVTRVGLGLPGQGSEG